MHFCKPSSLWEPRNSPGSVETHTHCPWTLAELHCQSVYVVSWNIIGFFTLIYNHSFAQILCYCMVL
jgi:hypothetical protein